MSEFRKELEDYFCKFTFGQFVTLILLELVTLFFVFYLGAHYGPDLIGDRSRVAENSANSEELPEANQPTAVDYTYPESLPDSAGGGAIRVKPSGVSAREFEKGKSLQRVEKPLPVVVPAPEKKTITTPIPTTSPVESESLIEKGGKFSIQVGAYRKAEEAALQVDKWKLRGYSTFMTVGEIPEKGTWYRVRIGRFDDVAEAKSFLKRFKEKEKSDGLVVTRN